MTAKQISKIRKHIAYMDKMNPCYTYECGVIAHYLPCNFQVNPYKDLRKHFNNDYTLFNAGLINTIGYKSDLKNISFTTNQPFIQGKAVAFRNPGYKNINKLTIGNPYPFFTEEHEKFQMGFIYAMIDRHLVKQLNRDDNKFDLYRPKRYCLYGPMQNYCKFENFISGYIVLRAKSQCTIIHKANELQAKSHPCESCNYTTETVFNIEKILINVFGEIIGKHLYATYLLF